MKSKNDLSSGLAKLDLNMLISTAKIATFDSIQSVSKYTTRFYNEIEGEEYLSAVTTCEMINFHAKRLTTAIDTLKTLHGALTRDEIKVIKD